LLADVPPAFASLRHLWADATYAGNKFRAALARLGSWTCDIVKKGPTQKGFKPLPRRWVVERTLAWLCRNRRLAKDYERGPATAAEYLYLAAIRLLTRRLTRRLP
jgi:putative transposase